MFIAVAKFLLIANHIINAIIAIIIIVCTKYPLILSASFAIGALVFSSGKASKNGILVKTSEALENVHKKKQYVLIKQEL